MQVLRGEVCGEKVNSPKTIGFEESLLFLEETVWCHIKRTNYFLVLFLPFKMQVQRSEIW